jgi:hypothetical protein
MGDPTPSDGQSAVLVTGDSSGIGGVTGYTLFPD